MKVFMINSLKIFLIISFINAAKIKKAYSEAPVHSLADEKNDLSRPSAYPYGVPLADDKLEPRKFADETYRVAFKIARYYRDVFEFIDEDADDWLDVKDVTAVFKNYNWPLLKGKSLDEMVLIVMERFGTKRKMYIDFIEFCGLMEYLWSLKAINEFFKCKERIYNNIEIVDKVYEFID
jgi:hypothetical protein